MVLIQMLDKTAWQDVTKSTSQLANNSEYKHYSAINQTLFLNSKIYHDICIMTGVRVLVGQVGTREHLLCMAEPQRDGWGSHQEIGGLEIYV